MRVAAVGDVDLGPGLVANPLAAVPLAGDVRFVNLECPLTTRPVAANDAAARPGPGSERLACDPARAAWLGGRVEVASLANNHALDRGPAGRDDSVAALARAGVAAAFAGHDAVVSGRGRPLAVVARDYAPAADLDDAGAELVAAVRAHVRAGRLVLVSLHWGHSGLYLPTPAQRRLAARVVDAGASAVLGHGPHTPMGVERRGRAVIAYSLGNFAFGCACTSVRDAFVLAFTLDGNGAAGEVTLTPLAAGLLTPPAPSHDAELRALLAGLARDLGADVRDDGLRLHVR